MTRGTLIVLAALAFGAVPASAAPLGQINEFSSGLGTKSDPDDGIASGPDGNLWFTDEGNPEAIGRMTTAGQASEFSSGLTGSPDLESGIAPGSDGNVWFADQKGFVGRITPSGQISEFSVAAGFDPYQIAPDAAGNLWFTEGVNATPGIGRVTPCAPLPCTPTIVQFTTGLAGTVPSDIAEGSDGNMWFTDASGTGSIGRITASGQVDEFPLSLGGCAFFHGCPGGIAAGADGNLWFVDPESVTPAIWRVTPCTPLPCTPTMHAFPLTFGSRPFGGIALGADGNMWFVDNGTTPAIGRITPGGQITEYSSGLSSSSFPFWITPGSDGNVWFTENLSAIGQIGTGAPAASHTPPVVAGTALAGQLQSCVGATWSSWAGGQPSPSLLPEDGYQWLVDGSPVAIGQTYTPTAALAGHQLSCRATVTYPLPLLVTTAAASAAVTLLPAQPGLTGLKQTHKRWRLGSKLATFAKKKHKPKVPVGTTFTLTLDEPASVIFVFAQRVTVKCGKHKHCTHDSKRGTLAFTDHAGTSKVTFDGRLPSTSKLKPGSYTVAIVATNAGGVHSAPQKLSFTILK